MYNLMLKYPQVRESVAALTNRQQNSFKLIKDIEINMLNYLVYPLPHLHFDINLSLKLILVS